MARKRVSRRQFLGAAGAAALSQMLGKSARAQAPSPQEIVSVSIHPAIGVARVGNSARANFAVDRGRLKENGAFIGPEVVQPDLFDPSFPAFPALREKDTGAIRRQAARFRIYGRNRLGQVRELTAKEADIQWSVHLANKKSQWYQFIAALDLPVPQTEKVDSLHSARRNPLIKGAARDKLSIDPGIKTIKGPLQQSAPLTDVFSIMTPPRRQLSNITVSLGQLATDEFGRLLVVGGNGVAGSPEALPIFNHAEEKTFNNADGWFDDISDGPVTATVTVRGQAVPLEAAPAWVFVAPPNFAPNVIGWRTLHDLVSAVPVVDPATGRVPPAPTQTSFRDDVLPLLSRLSGHQWVNKGFAEVFGKGGTHDFTDPNLLKRLSDRSETTLRRDVFELFRMQGADLIDKRKDLKDKKLWPMIYGDAFGTFKNTIEENLKVPDRAAFHLQNWVRGNYIDDFATRKRLIRVVEELLPHEQPAMLDRAALEYCLADAFHPGCEVTWPMRHPSLYMAPGRIKHRTTPEPDFRDQLTPQSVLQPGGPLEGQVPGGLTRWMALPWHGDTAFCRSGYEVEFDPFIPTFWAARVPNHVLTEQNYNIVVSSDARITRAQRQAAYQERGHWLRALQGEPDQQMLQMVNGFSQMGVVEARPGPANDPDFPPVMYVESLPAARAVAEAVATSRGAAPASTRADAASEPFKKAGWRDKRQRDSFLRLKGPK